MPLRQNCDPRQSLITSIPRTFLIQCVVVVVAGADLTAGGGCDVDGGAAHLLDPLALHLHLLREDQLRSVIAIPVGEGVNAVIIVVILQFVQD